MGDAAEICCAEHNVHRDAWEASYVQDTERCEKQLGCILVFRKDLSCSRDAEANDMIHMGSDHRSVMAQFLIPASQKEDSHKARIKWNTNSTMESIMSQADGRTRFHETDTFEQHCCELEMRFKQKTESAVAAHKPSEDETAAGMKQAEGDADANAAAAHNSVEN